MTSEGCTCGEGSICMYWQVGHPWCRPCGDHHRAPECAIDEQGRALCLDGRPWSTVE